MGVLRVGDQWRQVEVASLGWAVQMRFVVHHYACGTGEEEEAHLEFRSEIQKGELLVLQ